MKYKRIRSLARGIEVIRYLNRVKGAHPVDIGKEVGLPRPTVHRILQALKELDLVYQGASSREFRLTPGVRNLTGGARNFHNLRAAAKPIMHDLTTEVIWPSGLAVFHDDAMLIVESTDHLSPMPTEVGMIGQSFPLLLCSLGQAYISHCPETQRDGIIARLHKDAAGNDGPAFSLDAMNRMIEAGYRNGYSIFGEMPAGRCMSIAVPVHVDGVLIAAMNIVWEVADLTFEQGQKQLSGPLLRARDRIESKLSQSACASLASRDVDAARSYATMSTQSGWASSSLLPRLNVQEVSAI